MENEENKFGSAMPEHSEVEKDVHSFGERLYLAREQQGLTIEEVAKATHLSVEIIEAIERSDVDYLPQPIYVQGYIRVFAKYVGVPVDDVLEEYNRVVPHASESVLTPPPLTTHGPSSSTPLIKAVSMLLIILIVMAGIYGVFSYYSEIVTSMNNEPVAEDMEQFMPEDGIVDTEEGAPEYIEESVVDNNLSEGVSVEDEQAENDLIQERVMGGDTERAALIETQPIAEGSDQLNLIARKASWVEVVDGNGVKLHYNLVLEGKSIVLRGTAPFDIFLGNAPAVDVKINNVDIDTAKYVRSNKIAHFKVSMSDGLVVFH